LRGPQPRNHLAARGPAPKFPLSFQQNKKTREKTTGGKEKKEKKDWAPPPPPRGPRKYQSPGLFVPAARGTVPGGSPLREFGFSPPPPPRRRAPGPRNVPPPPPPRSAENKMAAGKQDTKKWSPPPGRINIKCPHRRKKILVTVRKNHPGVWGAPQPEPPPPPPLNPRLAPFRFFLHIPCRGGAKGLGWGGAHPAL